nr:NAD(P)H-dependent oxidoreductase [Spirochaeta isovalerica]
MIPWILKEAADDICYLNKSSLYDTYLRKAKTADSFLFVFPLYVDSMPGITKAYFEAMEQHKTDFAGKPVYFVIHSGFPEMVQSKALSHYNAYFATEIMGMDYKGTVIIGGSESMQMAPDQAFRKLQINLKLVGQAIKEYKNLPEDINIRINKRERLSGFRRFLFRITPGPLKNFYWHYRAGQHGEKIDLKGRPYG